MTEECDMCYQPATHVTQGTKVSACEECYWLERSILRLVMDGYRLILPETDEVLTISPMAEAMFKRGELS